MNSREHLLVRDGKDVLSLSHEHLSTYHGSEYPGGVALAWQALRFALPALAGGGVVRREDVLLKTPFPGIGFFDAVEMATRASSRKAFHLLDGMPMLGNPPASPNRGYFFFELHAAGGIVLFSLKHGLVPDEFYTLSEENARSPLQGAERERLMALRRAVGAALLASKPEDLFDCHHLSPLPRMSAEGEDDSPADLSAEDALPPLAVADKGLPLSITYGAMLRYAGRQSECGVAAAYMLLRQALPLLAREGMPERKDLSIRCGIFGKGIVDGLEMVTRAAGGGRLEIDERLGEGQVVAPEGQTGGSFLFDIAVGTRKGRFILKKALDPERYFELCRLRDIRGLDDDEKREIERERIVFSKALLTAEEAYEAIL